MIKAVADMDFPTLIKHRHCKKKKIIEKNFKKLQEKKRTKIATERSSIGLRASASYAIETCASNGFVARSHNWVVTQLGFFICCGAKVVQLGCHMSKSSHRLGRMS